MAAVSGKRVREVREAFKVSQQTLGDKINVSKTVIGDIEKGKRAWVDPKEFKAIAEALSITYERLAEEDTRELVIEIEEGLLNNEHPHETLNKALEFYTSYAIGFTEKHKAKLLLGRSYMNARVLDSANMYLKEAFEEMRSTNDLFGVGEAISYFMDCLFYMGDTKEMCNLRQEAVEQNFLVGNNEMMGKLHHYACICNYKDGNLSESLKDAKKAYEYYSQEKNKDLISRILNNIGELYYHMGDFQSAKQYFQLAISSGCPNFNAVCLMDKNLSRTLLAIGEIDVAISNIDSRISLMEQKQRFTEDYYKLVLMKADRTGSMELAEQVYSAKTISVELRTNAADMLVHHYFKGGDYQKFQSCYELVKGYKGEFTTYMKGTWF